MVHDERMNLLDFSRKQVGAQHFENKNELYTNDKLNTGLSKEKHNKFEVLGGAGILNRFNISSFNNTLICFNS